MNLNHDGNGDENLPDALPIFLRRFTEKTEVMSLIVRHCPEVINEFVKLEKDCNPAAAGICVVLIPVGHKGLSADTDPMEIGKWLLVHRLRPSKDMFIDAVEGPAIAVFEYYQQSCQKYDAAGEKPFRAEDIQWMEKGSPSGNPKNN